MPNEVRVSDPSYNDRPVSIAIETTAMEAVGLREWMLRGTALHDCPALVWDIINALRVGTNGPRR